MRIQRKVSKRQSVLPSQILLALALVVGVILLIIVIGGNQHSVQASRTPLQSSRTIMMDPSYDRSFSSLAELKQASDLVVLGTITNQRVVLNSHRVPSTISTVQVERTLKGAIASGQSVEMKQLGEVMPSGQHWALEGFPVLSLHTQYLFFLVPAFSNSQSSPKCLLSCRRSTGDLCCEC